VASHLASKSRKSLSTKSPNFQTLSSISNPSPPSKLSKHPKTPNSNHSNTKSRVLAQGEVIQEPWVYRKLRKVARTCASEASKTSPLIVLKNMQRMSTTPVYSSPKAHLSPEIGKFSVRERERESLEAKKMKENETRMSKGFFFFFNRKGWIEFGYIVFGLNGAQRVFS